MLANQIKTASDLRGFVESTRDDSHFFDRNTMRFFGDTMRNYGVRKIKVMLDDTEVEVYELYRRKPVKHGLQKSVYFHPETFKQVYPRSEHG